MYDAVVESALVEERELNEDPDRVGQPVALALEETLFARQGRWRRQQWSTSIVDVEAGRLQHLT